MAPLSKTISTSALQPGGNPVKERGGSLAEAMGMLASEVNELESAMKVHFEKYQPFLEPSQRPPDAPQAGAQVRAESPLATAVMEYVERVRLLRQGIEDMNDRLSY